MTSRRTALRHARKVGPQALRYRKAPLADSRTVVPPASGIFGVVRFLLSAGLVMLSRVARSVSECFGLR